MAKIKLGLVPLPQISIVAATPAPLSATSFKAQEVIIQADPGNAGTVYVGDASVSAGTSIKLLADRAIAIQADDTHADEDLAYVDLAEIYVDGTFTTDKVNIMVLQLQEVQY